MTHLSDDQLVLLAYGELPAVQIGDADGHLAACATCRARLTRLETGRVALDIALPSPRRRMARWVAAGLAAAAVLTAVMLTHAPPTRPLEQGWRPTSAWSATAGYVTGGPTMVEIDAQLTRLEQERYYGRPN